MSLNAENSLYTDIQNMYATYLDPEGPEYLHLPEDISIGIRQSKYFFKIPLIISIKVFRTFFYIFYFFFIIYYILCNFYIKTFFYTNNL